MPVRLVAVSAVVAASLTAAVPAFAADPPTRTVTAVAAASVKVQKDVAQTDAAIAAAVEAARAKVGPAAVANATEEAERLAAAGKLTLGPLISIAESQPFPYGPFAAYGLEGTFGPGKYCGAIRTPIFRKGKNGRRVFTRKFRSHHGCRVPAQVTATISVTFGVV